MINRYRSLLKNAIPLLLVGVLLVGIRPAMHTARYEAGLTMSPHIRQAPIGEFLGTAFVGGFRAVAVDIAWVRAMRLEREQKWFELLTLVDLIANLQPRMIMVWKYNAWKMAYNITVAVDDPEEAWQWVKKGLEYLKKGSRRNPTSWEMPETIAFFYYHRCGQIKDSRTSYYQKRLFEETGRTNWEHALEWMRAAVAVSSDIPPFNQNYIPLCLDRLARLAEEEGNLQKMRRLRLEALEEWRKIVKQYPSYEPGWQRIEDTGLRLDAYLLEEQARKLLPSDIEGWLKVAPKITKIWERFLDIDPWDEETIRHLKTMARAYEANAPVLFAVGKFSEAALSKEESSRLWRLLAAKSGDEESAAKVRSLRE